MPMGQFLRNESMKWGFTATAMSTRPTAWYLSLHDDDPTVDGSANEISGSSYARVAFTPARTNNTVTNTGASTFPTVTGSGYDAVWVGAWDASTSGNLLFYGQLSVPKSLAVGDALVFADGELDMDLV